MYQSLIIRLGVIVSSMFFCSSLISQEQISYIVKFASTTNIGIFAESVASQQLFTITPFIEIQSQNKYNTLSNVPSYKELQKYATITVAKNNEQTLIRFLAQSQGVLTLNKLRKFTLNESFPPNDSLSSKQWNIRALGLEKAWKISVGDGILVGVIDTGIDFMHNDLKDNIWVNPLEDSNGNGRFDPWWFTEVRNGVKGDFDGIDNDGNGTIDDIIGYDFVDQTVFNAGDAAIRDGFPFDEQGHGTQCSGIIAAKANNSIGVAGIAPKAKLVSLRAFDITGNAEEDDIAAAIVYAAMNGVRVLSMSFGDIVESPLVRDAINFAHEAGVTMFASSGNDNQQPTRLLRRYPASYEHVIAVGALTEKLSLAGFSSYGSYVSLCAPGTGVPTTRVGNRYNPSFQGTSAAAPHGAAVAALLLAANPQLSPNDIRGILLSTATDLGENGWDEKYGAGLINAEKCLENAEPTLFTIDYPQQGQVINTSLLSNITIKGNTLVPLFAYSELYYTKGDANEKTQWTQIGQRRNERTATGVLGTLPTTNLVDTSYTLRSVVYLTNGNTLERRIRIDIVSKQSDLAIQSQEIIPTWVNEKNKPVFTITLSQRCRVILELLSPQSTILGTFDYPQKISRNHTIILDYPFIDDEKYSLKMTALIDGADTLIQSFPLEFIDTRQYRTETMQNTGLTLPISYLSQEVSPFYSTNQTVAVINSETTKFGDLRLYEFSNNSFTLKESTSDIWIPQGFGDSNGDGINELLCYRRDASTYSSRTFQMREDGTTFKNSLFSNEMLNIRRNKKEFAAAAFFDIDNDGKDEIFGFRDSVLSIVRFNGTAYEEFVRLENQSPRGPDGRENTHERPFCLIDDIDNDGNYEIVFADSDADLMIYEYKNGEFTFEFSIIHEGEGGTEFLQSGDINGDGKKELVFGYYSYQGPSLQGEFDPSLWHYSIIHSTSPNVYEKLNTQYFYGVRIGSEFERGVRVANIDGKIGDELIISIFPKTYIMRWDEAKSELEPFWYCDTTFSRTAIILDRENSDKKLVGITTFNSVTFFETQDKNKPGPEIIIAKPINETTPLLTWKKFPNADSYTIDVYIFPYSPNSSPDYSFKVTSTEFSQEQFPTNTPYIFTITATSGNNTLSLPSFSPVVYLHTPSELINAVAQNNSFVVLKYSGYLPQTPISPFLFSLSDVHSNDNIIRPLTALIADDSTIILRFSPAISFTDAVINVAPFYDRFSLLTRKSEATITIPQNRQFDSLFLSSITVVNPTTLNVLFSKKVDEISVKDLNNYTIEPERFISSVRVDNESSITLFLDSSAPLLPIGKNYILIAKNLRDISGQPMTRGAGSFIGFTLAADNGDEAFMYPSPVRLSDKQPVFFGNLPPRATITIMTLDGVRLLTLEETDGNGGIEWNGLTENNEELSTGVYLYRVEGYDKSGNSIETVLKKFSVKK